MRRFVVACALAVVAALTTQVWAADEPPGSPTSPSTTRGPGAGQITIRWTAPLSVVTPAPTGYNIYRGTTSPVTSTARDDDAEADATYNIDYTDDTAVKRLVTTSDALTYASAAKLWIFAKATSCQNRGPSMALRVNGSNLTTFDRCSIWPSDAPAARSFDIPLSRITAGATNTFEIRVLSGYSWYFPLVLSVDQDNDRGRSDTVQNGVSLSGELMWWLEINRTQTNDDLVLAGTAGAGASSFVDSGLAAATTYHYNVRAVNQTAESAPSPTVLGTTYNVIGPPGGLSVTNNGQRGALSIGWQPANPGTEPGPTGYRVYRMDGSSPVFVGAVAAPTTSFTDTGLADSTSYPYVVSSVNVVGEGQQSSPVTGTTYSAAMPGAPVLSATPGGVSANLSWTLATPAGVQPATSFRVYRTGLSTGEPRALVTQTAVTSFIDRGLTPGSTYRYDVTAINDGGEGPSSNLVDITTSVPPGPVQGFSAVPNHCADKVTLSWSSPAAGSGGPVAGYRIWRGTAAGAETPLIDLPASQTSFTDTAAVRGSTYHYKVAALNDAGTSPQSSASLPAPRWGCWNFSNDGGFTKRADRTASDIGWNPAAGWVDVSAQRSDRDDEVFSRGLGARFTSNNTDFSVSVRWTSIATGSSQGIFPIYLSAAGATDIAEAPSTIYAYFSGGDAYAGNRPGYYLRYRDASGRQRLDGGFIPVGAGGYLFQGVQLFNNVVSIDYRASTRLLTMKVWSSAGAVVGSVSYTIGSNPGDGFVLDEIGVATNGQGGAPDQPMYGYIDDIALWHRGSAPMPPVVSTPSAFGEQATINWEPSPYDGGSTVTAYRIYRTVGSTEVLLAEVGAGVFTYVDTPPPGSSSYRVSAVSLSGEGQKSTPVGFTSTRP